MTTKQIEERSRIIMAISLEANCSIEEATKIAKHLKRVNTQLNWWNEKHEDSFFFNEYWKLNDETGEYENRLLLKLEKQVGEYIEKKIGCKYYINHDPRGHAVRLYTKTYHNMMDGETMAPAW